MECHYCHAADLIPGELEGIAVLRYPDGKVHMCLGWRRKLARTANRLTTNHSTGGTMATAPSPKADAVRKSITIDLTEHPDLYQTIASLALEDDRPPSVWLRRFLTKSESAGALK